MNDLFQQSIEFYDSFHQKLINDYKNGNLRMEKAITFVLNHLKENAKNILDIGCGIGWSSYELATNFPQSNVLGLDLSPKLIEIAQKLFEASNLKFRYGNILDENFSNHFPCNAIILIDVFEHIPLSSRNIFYKVIEQLLADQGNLFLTCPTVHHQNWLKTHRPEGLQPIDESITLNDVIRLAEALNGELIYFENQSIWMNDDYFHAIIQKKSTHLYKKEDVLLKKNKFELEPIKKRVKRIQTKYPNILSKQIKLEPIIALLAPTNDVVSETFIKAHRDTLKGNVHFLYGKDYPIFSNQKGKLKLEKSFFQKLKEKLFIYFKIQKYKEPHIEAFEAYLLVNNIQLVFCEYGTYAVKILDSVSKLQIPLIVHFHGYDAYKSIALENAGKKYPQLFNYANHLISVSRHMSNQLEKLGANPQKIIYNPCGVNPDFLKLQANYQSPNFIAIGRLVDKKAPYLTILAFHKVFQQYPNAKLKIIGNGYLWDVCKNLIVQLNLQDAIELLGEQSHYQVRAMMENAFCFVQHSIQTEDGDTEGTPVAILEAAAAGLPIISTFHAGIPEAVLHEKTGFLVNEKDITTMSKYMMQLFEVRTLAQQLGQAGKKHILGHYTMEKHIQILEEIIQKSIKNAQS